jgi:hypothetical protein
MIDPAMDRPALVGGQLRNKLRGMTAKGISRPRVLRSAARYPRAGEAQGHISGEVLERGFKGTLKNSRCPCGKGTCRHVHARKRLKMKAHGSQAFGRRLENQVTRDVRRPRGHPMTGKTMASHSRGRPLA